MKVVKFLFVLLWFYLFFFFISHKGVEETISFFASTTRSKGTSYKSLFNDKKITVNLTNTKITNTSVKVLDSDTKSYKFSNKVNIAINNFKTEVRRVKEDFKLNYKGKTSDKKYKNAISYLDKAEKELVNFLVNSLKNSKEEEEAIRDFESKAQEMFETFQTIYDYEADKGGYDEEDY